MITQNQLKSVVTYDPDSGIFKRISSGRRLGRFTSGGYLSAYILGDDYGLHRLAVLYMTGSLPEQDTDHANGNRADNRWSNISARSYSENQQNRGGPQRNNKLGVLGVRRKRNKFQAQIRVGGVQHYLGLFPTPEAAHAAYMAAKLLLHTNSPRLLNPSRL